VPLTWDDEIDAILGADLTAALGYRTPAGGTVVVAVAPIGLRDRAAGTVGFTTSLAFGNKLARIADDPRVAMAFHARDHGSADSPAYVLVQGRAWVLRDPTPEQRARVETLATAFLGGRKRGPFWDRWLREYYDVRVQVHVDVDRITVWPDLRCAGTPRVVGADPAEEPPPPQRPPKNGTGPRVDAERAGRRVRGTAHVLLGLVATDGYPLVLPVDVGSQGPDGLAVSARFPLPAGGRRAGLLGHSYRPQLIGLEARQYTGWLQVGEDGRGLYAPHTEHGYKAPANKTLLLFLNGALAKRGVRKARRAGAPALD
jgi:hypothetical protein